MSNKPPTFDDLFPYAEIERRKTDILIYGTAGIGKTLFALGWPKPLLIDFEGGASYYTRRIKFRRVLDKRHDALMDMIKRLQQDNGRTIETVIVDSLTVYYQLLQDAAMESVIRRNKANAEKYRKDYNPSNDVLSMREWGVIKRMYRQFVQGLYNLPINVIFLAHEKEIYREEGEGQGKTRVLDGVRPDVEKDTFHWVNLGIHLIKDDQGRRIAVIEKDNTDEPKLFGDGKRIVNLAYEAHFRKYLEDGQDGVEPMRVMSDEDAIAGMAQNFDGPAEEAPRPLPKLYKECRSDEERRRFTINVIRNRQDALTEKGVAFKDEQADASSLADLQAYAKELGGKLDIATIAAQAAAPEPVADDTADVPDDDAAR